MQLTIAHLYPDLFSLYGDKGNILALRQRLAWRGLACTVQKIGLADSFSAEQYDLVYLGGGLELQNPLLLQDLLEDKGPAIRQCVEQGTVFLAVNGGFWAMGSYLETGDGEKLPGLGILDACSSISHKRLTGKVVGRSELLAAAGSEPLLLGFTNRQTVTWLGPQATPLARLLAGPANNKQDNTEGAIYKNLYCTYILGGFLPLNPQMTDYLLETALKRRYTGFSGLAPLSDPFTENARNNLLNCR